MKINCLPAIWLFLLSVVCAFLVNPAYAAPPFDSEFWKTWGDGNAELAGYELTFPRYGELRKGVAIAVFVTETFSNSLRVKADPGSHAEADEFPVMKLNLIYDFSTGIYDYNVMTSSFIALASVNERPAGTPTKISLSSQEWCGHVYHALLFDPAGIRETLHSYFDGEADQSHTLLYPTNASSEDVLLLWARGFSAPFVEAGQSITVPMLTSLLNARLVHQAVSWTGVTLSFDPEVSELKIPAGVFQVQKKTAQLKNGRGWIFYVEAKPPRQVIRWETTSGEQALLLGSNRLKYWQLNSNKYRQALSEIGLRPRPEQTP